MTGEQAAQLAVILAPIAQSVVIEGTKVIATMRENITQENLNQALEASKSTSWPELDFKAPGVRVS
uniref:Uncharacterized protein n=1 Tax=Geobacter sp. (strain M21) TaxID=443144 RepID=C6E6S0_GEOSM